MNRIYAYTVLGLAISGTATSQSTGACTPDEVARENVYMPAGLLCDGSIVHCIFFPCHCNVTGYDCNSILANGTDNGGVTDGGGDVGEAEDETTLAPIDSPTAPPSAPQTTPSPQTCDQNCGTRASGGGSCDPNNSSICTSCNSGRLLLGDLNFNSQNGAFSDDYKQTFSYRAEFRVPEDIAGKCVTKLDCDARIVQFGPYANMTCAKCIDRRCFKCRIEHLAGAAVPSETCFKCRDGWYLQGNLCVEACESTQSSTGIGLFGRKCVDPFICKSNRVVNVTGVGCKCPNADNTVADKNCHTCAFNAGEFGQRCTNCKNNKFLHNEACQDDCSNAPGTVTYRHGRYGSSCRAPFVCLAGKDENNNSCTCKFAGVGRCQSCSYSLTGNSCLDN